VEKIMNRIIVVVLVAGMSQWTFAQRDDSLLSRYPPARLEALTTEKPAGEKVVALESLAAEIKGGTFSLQAAPGDVAHRGVRFRRVAGQFRTIATYTGEHRQADPELQKAIENWGGLAASRGGYGATIFRNELSFSQDGKVYWLPVSLIVLGDNWPNAPQHFRKGESYLLLGQSVGWLKDGRPILVVVAGVADKDFPRR
jgi:hypothetical protein